MLVDPCDIPVFITSFNLVTAPKALVDWLLATGTKRITLLDNASTYPPLLEWYERLPEGVSVQHLGGNFGPWGFWENGFNKEMDTPYIVTDPDCVPTESCPGDLVEKCMRLLHDNPGNLKVGPSLIVPGLDDLTKENWEHQFRRKRFSADAWLAHIDTTFAIYGPRASFCNESFNLRLDKPYSVYHTPNYYQEPLSEEVKFYVAQANRAWSHAWMRAGRSAP